MVADLRRIIGLDHAIFDDFRTIPVIGGNSGNGSGLVSPGKISSRDLAGKGNFLAQHFAGFTGQPQIMVGGHAFQIT